MTASYELIVRFSRTELAAAAPFSREEEPAWPTGWHCHRGWAQAGGGTGGEGTELVFALSQQDLLPPVNKPELRQSQGRPGASSFSPQKFLTEPRGLSWSLWSRPHEDVPEKTACARRATLWLRARPWVRPSGL